MTTQIHPYPLNATSPVRLLSSLPPQFHQTRMHRPFLASENPQSQLSGSLNHSNELSAPHEGFFYVLPYLSLREVLAVQMVCRSIRRAVDEDGLVWQTFRVEPPLSWRLTDELLIKIGSNAMGRMTSLALIDCPNITDSGLLDTVGRNPKISKLNLNGSNGLTPDGVVQAVKVLPGLKQLRINGLLNISKDHLNTFHSVLGITKQPSVYYKGWQYSTRTNDPIDVSLCPGCGEASIVYNCARKECKKKVGSDERCRGCYWCVPRCEECGGCMGLGEVEEMAACSHLLCSECWLTLPKCSMCNRAICSAHLPLISPCQRCSDCLVDEWSVNICNYINDI